MPESRGWTPPLSYQQYLHLMLRRDFWGEQSGAVHRVLHVDGEDHCSQLEDLAGVQNLA